MWQRVTVPFHCADEPVGDQARQCPTALPGIKINTSASSNMVWTQMQPQRWNGASWDQFGDVLDAGSE